MPNGVKHIGIVACSAEGAALCYRTICSEGTALLGTHDHPEVSLHGQSLALYAAALEEGNWPVVADLMLQSAHKLAAIGADFLICPDNTCHQALPLIEEATPLPWMSIANVVADEAARQGSRRVGIMGTQWLMEGPVYPMALEARGIAYELPNEVDRNQLGRIIMDELVNGLITEEAVAYHQRVIDDLRDRGCDAVVLGCTEIPLIINDTNSSLPTLDSTRLLARAAVRRAVA